LSERQLKEVVKAAAKGLQLAYHADKHGGIATSDMTYSINNAAALLHSEGNIKDYREDYLLSGPGQSDIRAAEGIVLKFQHQLAAMEENIKKTEGSIQNLRNRSESNTWIPSLFSGFIGMNYADAHSIYLRHATGLGFTYVGVGTILKQEELESQLTLMLEDQQDKEEYDQRQLELHEEEAKTCQNIINAVDKKASELTDADKGYILSFISDKDNPPPDEITDELLQDLLEQNREDLARAFKLEKEFREQIEGRRKKISRIRKQIKENKLKIKSGRIDPMGYLVIDGEKTDMRVIGITSDTSGLSFDSGTMGEIPGGNNAISSALNGILRPEIMNGDVLLAASPDGRLHSIGVLQSIDKQPEGKNYFPSETQDTRSSSKAKGEDGLFQDLSGHWDQTTALARPKSIEVTYQKNPFETLGILPKQVQALSAEELRAYVNQLAKALMRVTHPDFEGGGSPHLFKEISQAAESLSDEEFFRESSSQYGNSAPGAGRIEAIRQLQGEVRAEFSKLVPNFAAKKLEEAKEKRLNEELNRKMRFYLRSVIEGCYMNNLHPRDFPESAYLNREGVVMEIGSGKYSGIYTTQINGFDTFIELPDNKRVLLCGSTIPGLDEGPKEIMKQIKKSHEESYHLFIHPLLHPGSLVIGITEKGYEVLGEIRKIDSKDAKTPLQKKAELELDPKEATAIARKMAERPKPDAARRASARKKKNIR